jgi:hypothetical protein
MAEDGLYKTEKVVIEGGRIKDLVAYQSPAARRLCGDGEAKRPAIGRVACALCTESAERSGMRGSH